MKSLNWVAGLKSLIGMGLVLLAVSSQVQAAPGTILFQDNFERSNVGSVGNGWVITPVANVVGGGGGGGGIDCVGVTGNTGCAGIDSDVPPWNVPSNLARANTTKSMFTRWNGVQVASPAINLAVPAAQLTYWLRRGSDCFSEWPGNQQTGCTYTAKITVVGTTSTSVSGITINGVQIMSAASTAATSQNTVAANIKAKINVAGSGFTASVNNNVVTITGANVNAYSALPVITVGSGTMTFTSAFSPVYAPNYGEEFEVQYLNSGNTWVNLKKYPAEGPPGEQFRPVIELPSDALWSGFKIRFFQPSGSGSQGTGGGATGVVGYDYWHMDDVVVTELAATNYIGSFCDNFEGGLTRWTATGFGDASIGSTYFQGGVHDLDIRWDTVTVTSKPTNMTAYSGPIQFWVKRGLGSSTNAPNNTGSDWPTAGHDLLVEYLTTTAGVWKALVPANTFVGGGTQGQVWCPTVGTNCVTATPATNSITIPADANLTSFQLRFRMLAGAGYDHDYWHVDDVCIGAVAQPTDLSLTIAPTGTTTLTPGRAATITLTVTNNGPNIDPGAITVTDTLPAGLSLNGALASSWSSGTLLPGATSACTSAGQTVTCTRVGSLAVGASTVLSLQIQADPSSAGSGLLNTATVSGQSTDTNLANNTATNYYSFVPAAFEAYETSTAAGAISGQIYTKLVGTAFNLQVIAINAGSISTGYNRIATVDLVDGSVAVSAATCAAATALTGVTVSPASYTYTTGTGNDNGVHTFAFTVANAYRNVKVRVKDNNSAVGCSSDNFAIRPSAAFAITSTNANNNTTAGTTVVKTGASFNLNATLLAGYDGTPSIDTTLVTGTPTAGILAGSFGVAAIATGIATGSGFTYSEAGNLGFAANAVFDSVFTAVDQTNDCVMTAGLNFSNTIDANGKFGCNIGSVAITPTGTGGFGRFIPDHFETAINSVANVPMPCPTGVVCPVFYNGFVYSGQPFTVLVTAKNLGGATTVNYAGAYAHTVGYGAWDGIGSSTTNNPSAGTLGITTAGTFVAGVSTPVLNYAIAATAAPTNIYIRATETEVSSLRTTNPTTTSIEGGVTVASGRVKVPNAIGSELLTLPMVANVQFYNGSYWVTSTTDNVTSLTLPASYNVAYKGAVTGTTTPTPTGANAVTGGKLNIRLSKPTGGSGSATVTVAPPSYLPVAAGTGLATFGVYKGNNEFIYQRENY